MREPAAREAVVHSRTLSRNADGESRRTSQEMTLPATSLSSPGTSMPAPETATERRAPAAVTWAAAVLQIAD
jgi:hypothetical protein